MKYNKEIERQYTVERLKRRIRVLLKDRAVFVRSLDCLDYEIIKLKLKLRAFGEKFYA